MSNNNFGYGDNYPSANGRVQASQSSHQHFSTTNATAAPYYGLQTTETPGRTYTSKDYQYGQYSQISAATANDTYNWGGYRPAANANASSLIGLQAVAASKVPAQNTYDADALGSLSYGSGLSFGTTAETTQPGYSSSNAYGTQHAVQRPTTQYDQNPARPAAMAQGTSQVAGSQAQIPAMSSTPRAATIPSYSLQPLSPTCPQGLVDSYAANSPSANQARAGAQATARTTENSALQPSTQQTSYTAASSHNYGQPPRVNRLSPEMMRKANTPTPPVPPMRKPTPETRNTSYSSQQQGRNTRTRQLPSHSPSVTHAPVNVIMPTVGQPQQRPKKGNGMYQPRQAPTASQSTYAQGQGHGMYQQSQQVETRSQLSSEQPTTVDSSLVYNRYHEYQKEVEAQAARVAKEEEERRARGAKEAAETAEKERLEAIRLREETEAARLAKEKEKKKTAKAAKAAPPRAAKEAEKSRRRQESEAASLQAAQTLSQTLPSQQSWHEGQQGLPKGYVGEVQGGDASNDSHVDGEHGSHFNDEQRRESVESMQMNSAHSQNGQHQVQMTPQPTRDSTLPQSLETPANTEMDEAAQMVEELRRTVEKLRTFQSKDPKLFLKLWSSVRKSDGEPGQSPQPQSQAVTGAAGGTGVGEQPSHSQRQVPVQQGQGDVTHPPQLRPLLSLEEPKRSRKKKTCMVQADGSQNAYGAFESEGVAAANEQNGASTFETENPSVLPMKRRPGRPRGSKNRLHGSTEVVSQGVMGELRVFPAAPKVRKKPGPKPKNKQPATPVQLEVDPALERFSQIYGSAPPATQSPVPHQPPQQQQPRTGALAQAAQPMQQSGAGDASSYPAQGIGTENAAVSSSYTPRPHMIAVTTSSQGDQSGVLKTPLGSATPNSQTAQRQQQQQVNSVSRSMSRMTHNAQPQNQTAQWPDEHIDLIAETGSKLLNSLPQNSGKKMHSDSIRNMLKRNPSYVQVCEMIEKAGFFIDRSKFARTLLAVISPQNPQSAAAKPQGQHAGSPAVATPDYSGQFQQPKPVTPSGGQMATPASAPAAARPAMSEPPNTNLGYQPPKYGSMPGVAPTVQGAFVREPPVQANGGRFQSHPAPQQSPTTVTEADKHISPHAANAVEMEDSFQSQIGEIGDDDDGRFQSLSAVEAFNRANAAAQGSAGPRRGNQPAVGTLSQNAAVPSPHKRAGSYNQFWRANRSQPPAVPEQYISPAHWPQAPNTPDPGVPGFAGISRPLQISHSVPASKPFARPWNTQDNRKRPFAATSDMNRGSPSILDSSKRPRPWVDRINSSAVAGPGARAASQSASPFRVNQAATPLQPPPPHLALNSSAQQPQTTYRSIHVEEPYIQVNIVEQQHRNKENNRNPLLEFDGIVQPIGTSVARRRTRYNPKTIARDVLIATGRHQTQRALNAHLEGLKRFRAVNNDSDLSTFRWDIVDPGGDAVGSAKAELMEKMAVARQGPAPTRGNRFNISSRSSRPSSLRNGTNADEVENEPMVVEDGDGFAVPARKSTKEMSEAPSRRTTAREGRNQAPNYKPMTSAEILGLKVRAGKRRDESPASSVSSVVHKPKKIRPNFVNFRCKWQGCGQDLVNLETLMRHVIFVHGQNDDVVSMGKTCLWHACGAEDYTVGDEDYPGTHFDNVKEWKKHMNSTHFDAIRQLYGDGAQSDAHGKFIPF